MSIRTWAIGVIVSVLGCGGVVTPDTGTGDGGAGGAPTNTPTGGACPGCMVDGACVEPTAEHCGTAGATCAPCAVGVCEVAECLGGICEVSPAPDGEACPDGVCSAGACAP